MVEPPNETLVNGKPVDDEAANSPSDKGSGDVHGAGDTPDSNGEAGTGSEDDQAKEPGSVGFEPPGSVGEIKDGIKAGVTERFHRIKRDGPEPIRQAAKGIIDSIFDAVDAGFARWFGEKK